MVSRPNPPIKEPNMNRVEREYLSQTGVLPDDPTPICDRWATVCRYYPDAARGSLSGDWTNVFKHGIEHETGQHLFALHWLTALRQGLYYTLFKHRVIFKHVYLRNAADSEYWAGRLYDKLSAEDTRMIRRVGTRIRSGIQGPWTHTWIN